MEYVLTIVQLVIAVVLIVIILIQQKGAGLGAAFGGGGGGDNVYATKRGAEKVLYFSTIVLSVLFLGIAIFRLFIV